MAQKLGGAITGGLAGAGTGAAIGSIIPGVGTGIGAAAGGLIGLLGGYFGAPDKDKFVSTLNPEQQKVLQMGLSQLQQQGGPGGNYQQSQDYLGSLLGNNQQAYEQFAAPHRTNFYEQTIPRIAERFAGLGGGLGGGALSSTGFGQALGGAGAQYESNIANLFANVRQNAAAQAMNNYGNLFNSSLGNFQAYQPGSPGFGANALSGLSQGVSTGIGQGFGNQIGNKFSGNNMQNNNNFDMSGYM